MLRAFQKCIENFWNIPRISIKHPKFFTEIQSDFSKRLQPIQKPKKKKIRNVNMRSTNQPSESWALTSQPNWTRNFTISKCPAQIALCRAVIPSSLAALGFFTCPAVLTTSSSSPSNEASNSSAKGSNETLRLLFALFVFFRLPFLIFLMSSKQTECKNELWLEIHWIWHFYNAEVHN